MIFNERVLREKLQTELSKIKRTIDHFSFLKLAKN